MTKPPWDFWNARDMRTLIDVAKGDRFDPKSIEFVGTRHNALCDAKHQARVISAAYQHLVVRV